MFNYSVHPHNFPCSRPTADRLYVKILNFIKHNPGSNRNTISLAVTGYPAGIPGEWASISMAGLYRMVRQGRTINYYITDKGLQLLASVGL